MFYSVNNAFSTMSTKKTTSAGEKLCLFAFLLCRHTLNRHPPSGMRSVVKDFVNRYPSSFIHTFDRFDCPKLFVKLFLSISPAPVGPVRAWTFGKFRRREFRRVSSSYEELVVFLWYHRASAGLTTTPRTEVRSSSTLPCHR